MHIERLLKIINLLTEKKTITAKELAERFDVSTKTIYRNLDTLTLANIPVVTTRGRNGGISILENHKINKNFIKDSEQLDILNGLGVLNTLEYSDIEDTIIKLKNVFNKDSDDLLEIDFSCWGSSTGENKKFKTIKKALFNHRALDITYTNNYGDKTKRTIYPLKLIFKNTSWYLAAFCIIKNDYRVFKIRRILNPQITDITFNKSNYPFQEIADPYFTSEEQKGIVLKFNSNCSKKVFNEFEYDMFTQLPNNELIVKFKSTLDKWLCSYIFTFENNVEILEPTSLKTIYIKMLKVSYKNL